MALKIRLRQQGKKNNQVYRLVLSDVRSPRDGKYIEMLGWYNPHEAEPEKNLKVDGNRVLHWLNQGAILTDRAEQLVLRAAPEVIEAIRKKNLEKRAKACEKRRALRKKETALA